MVLGPVLLPRLLGSAERISPEVKQEDLSLGPYHLCTLLCRNLEPWVVGATVPGLLVPIPTPLGPLASGLCEHQSALKSPEANLGGTAASLAWVGPGPLLPPAAGPHPPGPAESSVCSLMGLPAPSQLEGSGVRWETKPSKGLECEQDRAGGAKGVITSTLGWDCVLCLYFEQGRVCRMEALK